MYPKWLDPVYARNPAEKIPSDKSRGWSVFQRDVGSVVHSNLFKRLANKTQVHSLPTNDHVRTRLTHSVEAAQIGRQLARLFHEIVLKNINSDDCLDEIGRDLEDLTEATCLIHDVGHPPFGHTGQGILADLSNAHKFDDNKQVVRVLLNPYLHECLNLSAPLVASVPKKFGIENNSYPSEKDSLSAVFTHLGICENNRHPVSFLMEAADDIAYVTSDLLDYFTFYTADKNWAGGFNEDLMELLRDIKVEGESLADVFSKAEKAGEPKKFSDQLIKSMIHQVEEVLSEFGDSKPKIDELPAKLSTWCRERPFKYEKKGKQKEDYNLIYIDSKNKKGSTFGQLKNLVYDKGILSQSYIAARDLQADVVLNGIWLFIHTRLSSEKPKLTVLDVLPPEDKGYLLGCIDRNELEAGIIDVIGGMTDRFATEFWEKLRHPIEFRNAG